jgi:hypothetical protein
MRLADRERISLSRHLFPIADFKNAPSDMEKRKIEGDGKHIFAAPPTALKTLPD